MRITALTVAALAVAAVAFGSTFQPLRNPLPVMCGGNPIPTCPYKTCNPLTPPATAK